MRDDDQLSVVGADRFPFPAAVDLVDLEIRIGHRGQHVLGAAPPDTGVRSRVLQVATSAASSLDFDPQIRFDGPLDTIVPEPVGAHLLAVIREALSNTARHAKATSVSVDVSTRHDTVRVEVGDDGVGFAEPERISGLANIRTRAAEAGGGVDIISAPGAGTRIVWWAPLSESEHDDGSFPPPTA